MASRKETAELPHGKGQEEMEELQCPREGLQCWSPAPRISPTGGIPAFSSSSGPEQGAGPAAGAVDPRAGWRQTASTANQKSNFPCKKCRLNIRGWMERVQSGKCPYPGRLSGNSSLPLGFQTSPWKFQLPRGVPASPGFPASS